MTSRSFCSTICGIWAQFAIILVGIPIGCVSKPVQIHVLDDASGAPIANASILQHGARFLDFIPRSGDAIRTNDDGRADLVLNARGTSLALLRAGYVPTGLSIVPAPRGAKSANPTPVMHVDASPQNYLEFESLAPHALIDVRLTPIVPWQIRICVRDERGAPLPAAEAIVETGLFLPKDGTEGEWGRPPLLRLVTDASGCTVVTAHRGLRNYLYVRMAGRMSERIALDALEGTAEVAVTLQQVEFKPVILRVVDGATGAPIEFAVVELGKQFDGIARDPNGWSVKTDANGCTPTVSVPDLDCLVVTVASAKFHARREPLCWKALGTVRPTELKLDRR